MSLMIYPYPAHSLSVPSADGRWRERRILMMQQVLHNPGAVTCEQRRTVLEFCTGRSVESRRELRQSELNPIIKHAHTIAASGVLIPSRDDAGLAGAFHVPPVSRVLPDPGALPLSPPARDEGGIRFRPRSRTARHGCLFLIPRAGRMQEADPLVPHIAGHRGSAHDRRLRRVVPAERRGNR